MIEYKILKAIESNPSHTQRSLAGELGVSLGKLNYILSGLVEKGIVKARRLKDQPGSISWRYILTPKGIREKLLLTRNYLDRREAEYLALKREIAVLKREVREGRNK